MSHQPELTAAQAKAIARATDEWGHWGIVIYADGTVGSPDDLDESKGKPLLTCNRIIRSKTAATEFRRAADIRRQQLASGCTNEELLTVDLGTRILSTSALFEEGAE